MWVGIIVEDHFADLMGCCLAAHPTSLANTALRHRMRRLLAHLVVLGSVSAPVQVNHLNGISMMPRAVPSLVFEKKFSFSARAESPSTIAKESPL